MDPMSSLGLTAYCVTYSGDDCGGQVLGTRDRTSVLSDTGSDRADLEFLHTIPDMSRSAECGLELTANQADFGAYLDRMRLIDPEGVLVFFDGFETGDTSEWSLSVP